MAARGGAEAVGDLLGALLRGCGAAGRCPRATDGDVGAGASLLPAAGGQRHPPGACRHPAWGGGRRAGPPGVGRRQPRRRSGSGGPAGRCPCPHLHSSPALHSGPCGASGGGGVAGGALSLLAGRLEGQRRRKVGRLRPRVPKPAPASFAVSFSRQSLFSSSPFLTPGVSLAPRRRPQSCPRCSARCGGVAAPRPGCAALLSESSRGSGARGSNRAGRRTPVPAVPGGSLRGRPGVGLAGQRGLPEAEGPRRES